MDGAQAGILMPAEPMVGQDAYRQEYAAGVAEDNGEVLASTLGTTVPAGSYDELCKRPTPTRCDPDAPENKFYARGVGPVLTIDVAGGGREGLLAVVTVPDAEARRAATDRSDRRTDRR